MKKFKNYKISSAEPFLWCGMLLLLFFAACSSDDDEIGSPVVINSIYLQDVNSEVPDRQVEFARLGQNLRLEGSGFKGIQKVLVNGFETNFNQALATDINMWLRISSKTPTLEADPELMNTIILIKGGERYVFPFEIRSAPPSITSLSHTMPKAGERITIYGVGLEFIESVTFPGGVTVTEGIESDDEEGEFCRVTVPENVSEEGGSLLVVGVNGGAYSPEYFNFKPGLLHNFDNVDTGSWSTGRVSEDLNTTLPGSGEGPQSQGTYRSLNVNGEVLSASDALVDVSRYWIDNSVWASRITGSVISPNTPSDEVAVQMDIYVEGEWNSGNIRFVIADGFGASRYAMLYAPWESGGKRVAFENPGSWFTITLPFSDSEDFEGSTFQDILDVVASASYAQAGPWLENGPINGVEAEDTDINVYFDNIRIVPLNTPQYSDFD